MMNIELEPGSYVIAVSGGVDSVVLLHRLRTLPGLQLTVAHFDHGIRDESAEDQQFVRQLARMYGLPYVYKTACLGSGASEAAARQARYDFLYNARTAAGARAILTAHHQDDVLETAILNILRGSGRRGLTSLQSTDIIKRPLLHVRKAEIIQYACDNQLRWHEDSTNFGDTYKRNYVRHQLLSRFSLEERLRLNDIIVRTRQINQEIDERLGWLLQDYTDDYGLRRAPFIMLPHAVARELTATWLRQQGITELTAKLVQRLVQAAKTFPFGRSTPVSKGWELTVGKRHLALRRIER